MANKEKLTKRELQSPDKFQTRAGGWFDWAHEHPKEIAIGGAALLAVIILVGVIFGGRKSESVDPQAGADLSAALELVERPVVPEGGEKPQGVTETFPTEQAKQEAIVVALTDVRKEHGGTTTATSAALPLADAKYKLGQYDEAIALYDEYLKEAPKNASLRFMALEGRALSLEAKGDLDQAIEAYDRLGSESASYKDRALYGKGRLLERQEKWNDARAAYQQLEKDFPDSPVTRMGKERLAALDARHPAPPAPKAEAAAPAAGE